MSTARLSVNCLLLSNAFYKLAPEPLTHVVAMENWANEMGKTSLPNANSLRILLLSSYWFFFVLILLPFQVRTKLD